MEAGGEEVSCEGGGAEGKGRIVVVFNGNVNSNGSPDNNAVALAGG